MLDRHVRVCSLFLIMCLLLLLLISRTAGPTVAASIICMIFRRSSKTGWELIPLFGLFFFFFWHLQCQDWFSWGAGQNSACPLFLFPSCAVQDKAGLFVQQLIAEPTCWCPSTSLISLCLQLRKDFLLVLLVPVWTGSIDERWGAAKDRGRDLRAYGSFCCRQHLLSAVTVCFSDPKQGYLSFRISFSCNL